MELTLNEEDVKNLRIQVREATKAMIPDAENCFPSHVTVTMTAYGEFDMVLGMYGDDIYVLPVASINRPHKPFISFLESQPTDPYDLYVIITSHLFECMKTQINGYMAEYIAEEVFKNAQKEGTHG